jgi:hypothetical protein
VLSVKLNVPFRLPAMPKSCVCPSGAIFQIDVTPGGAVPWSVSFLLMTTLVPFTSLTPFLSGLIEYKRGRGHTEVALRLSFDWWPAMHAYRCR